MRVVESLAKMIFFPTYSPYVHVDHIDYFLKRFQSVEAIQEQIKTDYEYYLYSHLGEGVGYLGIQWEEDQAVLSKLYFLPEFRNQGWGLKALDWAEERARIQGKSKMELVVNENNSSAIRFYQKHGFHTLKAVTHSFDNGHSVQDLILIKDLSLD